VSTPCSPPHPPVVRLLALVQDARSSLSWPALQHTAAQCPAPSSDQGRQPRSRYIAGGARARRARPAAGSRRCARARARAARCARRARRRSARTRPPARCSRWSARSSSAAARRQVRAPPAPRARSAARPASQNGWCAARAAVGLQQAASSGRVLAARFVARCAASLPGEEAALAVRREASHSASSPFAVLWAGLFLPCCGRCPRCAPGCARRFGRRGSERERPSMPGDAVRATTLRHSHTEAQARQVTGRPGRPSCWRTRRWRAPRCARRRASWRRRWRRARAPSARRPRPRTCSTTRLCCSTCRRAPARGWGRRIGVMVGFGPSF